jgi:hemoglobin-like flavoprotein
MPGDPRHDGSGIESYDQWLAWEDGLRLRRNQSRRHRQAAEPSIPDVSTWGDQALLEASLGVVAPQAAYIVPHFYGRLFSDHPYLRRMFPSNMTDQNERLLNALLALVQGVDDPDHLVRQLIQLGRDHRKFGVREIHYAAVGKALIATLVHFAGAAWTDAIQQAWLDRYTFAVNVMTASAEADDQPPYWFATVVSHKHVGSDLAIIQLRPRHPYLYEPGQHATISSAKLARVWRPYTVACGANELEFHVRADGHGDLSDILVHDTSIGDVLRLGAPMGDSLNVPARGRTRVLISDGTGWAKMKALLERLVPGGDRAYLVQIEPDGHPYDPDWPAVVNRFPELSTMVVRHAAQAIPQLPPEYAQQVQDLGRDDAFQEFWPPTAS